MCSIDSDKPWLLEGAPRKQLQPCEDVVARLRAVSRNSSNSSWDHVKGDMDMRANREWRTPKKLTYDRCTAGQSPLT